MLQTDVPAVAENGDTGLDVLMMMFCRMYQLYKNQNFSEEPPPRYQLLSHIAVKQGRLSCQVGSRQFVQIFHTFVIT